MDVLELAPLVNRLARVARRGLPSRSCLTVEDLRQAGWIAALEAIGRWQAMGVARFEPYAAKRILGAMLDLLRECRTQGMHYCPAAMRFASFEDLAGTCDPCSYDASPQLAGDRLTAEEELVLVLYATHDDPAEPRAARAVERQLGKRVWPIVRRARAKLEALAA